MDALTQICETVGGSWIGVRCRELGKVTASSLPVALRSNAVPTVADPIPVATKAAQAADDTILDALFHSLLTDTNKPNWPVIGAIGLGLYLLSK